MHISLLLGTDLQITAQIFLFAYKLANSIQMCSLFCKTLAGVTMSTLFDYTPHGKSQVVTPGDPGGHSTDPVTNPQWKFLIEKSVKLMPKMG
jgi:hypothetical protein